jgi:hypothetical protein
VTIFHDLARRLDDLDAPPADLEELVALGESRLRRRRLRTAVACAVAIAVLTVGGVLVDDHHTQGTGPIDLPGPRPTQKQTPTAPATRQVVYAGGLGDPTIHYGHRKVKVRTGYVHLDVTDDGFVYTTPGLFQKADPTVWFSDGRAPERIGTHCGRSSHLDPNDVMTGSSGSLAVWFACSKAAGHELVVYDTSLSREVLRRQITGCRGQDRVFECELTAFVGDHVFLVRHVGESNFVHGLSLDLGTNTLRTVTSKYWVVGGFRQPGAYLAELRSQPRALVVGGSFGSGAVTDGIGVGFTASGSRLVPRLDTEGPATRAYDTTGRPVRLHLPSGYHRAKGFSLVQWLDDDTIALAVHGEGPHSGDVVTCHLSNGRCEQVVTGPGSDTGVGSPIFPQQQLPG